MTEDTAAPAEPGTAAPAEPEAGASAEDLSSEAADLQAKLDDVRAKAQGGETARVKVEKPHSAFVHGHTTVGNEFTTVPASQVPAMMEAAANSGVTLTQEES